MILELNDRECEDLAAACTGVISILQDAREVSQKNKGEFDLYDNMIDRYKSLRAKLMEPPVPHRSNVVI